MLLFTVPFLVSVLLKECSVLAASHSLPKNFKQCKINDPDLGKCLEQAVPDAFRKMKKDGIPSLGIFPLEPLVVNDIKIDPASTESPVNLKLHFKNIKIYGIPDTTLFDYDARMKDLKLVTSSYTPKLWFEADYIADGRILLLPVKGNGQCNITMNELKAVSELSFKEQNKKGETYWIIQDYKNKFTPKKLTMHFDGLLNGDKALNDGINQFLNENWQIIYEELRPSFEEAFGAVFKEITHRVFSKVPINRIFLN